MICEYCGKEHDGLYGSGRFCSYECKMAFAGSSKRRTGYVRSDSKLGGWTCLCGLNFRTRKLLSDHKKECSVWNKAKKFGHLNQFTKAKALGLPKPVVSDETREKLSLASSKYRASDETKKKISEGMKKAHAEGRAHNIGECRWNNEP